MELQETLDTLRSLGTEQARKTYRRHGAAEDVYGVSYAELGKLKKKIKVDHALAEGLWASGNHDARMLAAMVADPARLDQKTLDAWAAGLRNYVETDALGTLAASVPHAREVMTHWMASGGEWVAALGWKLLAHVARQDDGVTDEYFERYLATIERDIAESPNRVRHQMNSRRRRSPPPPASARSRSTTATPTARRRTPPSTSRRRVSGRSGRARGLPEPTPPWPRRDAFFLPRTRGRSGGGARRPGLFLGSER
jgi:3-methyladenine DNA glycosylase AlkD